MFSYAKFLWQSDMLMVECLSLDSDFSKTACIYHARKLSSLGL